VTDRNPTDVQQYPTHEELVEKAVPSYTRTLDAIIVPASRSADNLSRAIALARAANCQLILLCSRQARVDDVGQLLADRKFGRATVIELPNEYRHDLFEFSTSRWVSVSLPKSCAARDSDLSMKRNVGLMLARLLGWNRIFFLDDDVRGFGPSALLSTASAPRRYRTVGMRATNFPDNSVMCHAHRETGGFQDVHVSGSALAVDCSAPINFFPDIYNEDWLFFYQDAMERRLGSAVAEAKQLGYDPFDSPIRAARQEFGDVLGEGLHGLLHRGGYGYPSGDYWSRFLDARRSFLSAISDRIQIARPEKQVKIRRAVETAQHCLRDIQPEHCEEYISLWKDDLGRWDQRLNEIPRMSTMADALDHLELVPAEDSNRVPLIVDMHLSAQLAQVTIPDFRVLDGPAAQTSPGNPGHTETAVLACASSSGSTRGPEGRGGHIRRLLNLAVRKNMSGPWLKPDSHTEKLADDDGGLAPGVGARPC
jgi:hypothetical protein